jgi:hypothetical protein
MLSEIGPLFCKMFDTFCFVSESEIKIFKILEKASV